MVDVAGVGRGHRVGLVVLVCDDIQRHGTSGRGEDSGIDQVRHGNAMAARVVVGWCLSGHGEGVFSRGGRLGALCVYFEAIASTCHPLLLSRVVQVLAQGGGELLRGVADTGGAVTT